MRRPTNAALKRAAKDLILIAAIAALLALWILFAATLPAQTLVTPYITVTIPAYVQASPPATQAVNVILWRSSISGGPYTKVTTLGLTATSWQDTTCLRTTTCYYVTSAIDAAGNTSPYSTETSATMSNNGGNPAVYTGVSTAPGQPPAASAAAH